MTSSANPAANGLTPAPVLFERTDSAAPAANGLTPEKHGDGIGTIEGTFKDPRMPVHPAFCVVDTAVGGWLLTSGNPT